MSGSSSVALPKARVVQPAPDERRRQPRSFVKFLLGASVLLALGPAMDSYTQSVLAVAFLFGVTAVTVDLLWGYTGILSYAQSAFFGLGAYGVAVAVSQTGAYTVPMALLGAAIGVICAVVTAFIFGALSFHSKANWLYIAVVTFAAPFIFQRAMLSGGTFTGSSSGLAGFSPVALSPLSWYWLCGAFLIVVLVCAYVFTKSDMGTVLRAIRDNETRCRFVGVRVHRIKLYLFAALSVVSALAGVLYALSQNVVAPDIGSFELATQMIIWTAVGGRATLFGPVVAAIGVNWATASLSGDLPFLWQLLLGIVFVVVVMYFPAGAAGMLKPLWQRLLRKSGTQAPTDQVVLRAADKGDNAADKAGGLELDGVVLQYGAVRAVSGLSFQAVPGELVSIVGPNGAGKTSAMHCISDGRKRTSGTVRVSGTDTGNLPPEEVSWLGVGQKFQHASVFSTLTVGEALRVARYSKDRPSLLRRDEELELPQLAIEVLEATDLTDQLRTVAGNLSHGEKQALELALLLATDPSVVLLDEPTAGLSHAERLQLGRIFQQIASEFKRVVILVEHDLEFVRNVSSRIIVMNNGELILDGSVADVVESDVVREIYTGSVEEADE